MSGYVIDASVAAKWLFLEKGSDEAQDLLGQFDYFYAPDLFRIEVESIINKKVRKKERTETRRSDDKENTGLQTSCSISELPTTFRHRFRYFCYAVGNLV